MSDIEKKDIDIVEAKCRRDRCDYNDCTSLLLFFLLLVCLFNKYNCGVCQDTLLLFFLLLVVLMEDCNCC